MEYRDYYKTLGVARTAGEEEIKRAYRRLARKYHPDVSKEANAEERFKEVQEAYEVLKDPAKRTQYDQLGSNWKSGQEFRPPPGWQGFGGFSQDGFNIHEGEEFNFSDFFASLFGRQGQGPGSGGIHMHEFGGGRARGPARGQDEHARILISLEEAFRGGSQTINLQTGRQVRTLKITIPAGILPGQQLRLAKQGSALPGRQPGDLYLEIGIRPHPVFTLEGRNVSVTVPITPWEAALGAKIPVPTLAGTVELKIAAGSQSGQKLRLKGRGFPGKPAVGDQYVILKIMTPPVKTEADRAFYEKMAADMPYNPRENIE